MILFNYFSVSNKLMNFSSFHRPVSSWPYIVLDFSLESYLFNTIFQNLFFKDVFVFMHLWFLSLFNLLIILNIFLRLLLNIVFFFFNLLLFLHQLLLKSLPCLFECIFLMIFIRLSHYHVLMRFHIWWEILGKLDPQRIKLFIAWW